jgi:protein gp37
MGRTTGIEWTDATWNPIRGCTRVSEGCRNCYAERVAARFSGPGLPYEGLAILKDGEARWTGKIRFVEEHLRDPLKWKVPMRIFVNSMSDLFHPGVTDDQLGEIFDVMARTKHTFQILTKRPARMKEVLDAAAHPDVKRSFELTYGRSWPPPEWQFGVSIEDQKTANERLPILADCIARTKIVSYEPAIGEVDFAESLGGEIPVAIIDWIIAGGESGANARPVSIHWLRKTRDLCQDLGIPFFFKQWGEWRPVEGTMDVASLATSKSRPASMQLSDSPLVYWRFGKQKTGSMLDGVEWKEFPK